MRVGRERGRRKERACSDTSRQQRGEGSLRRDSRGRQRAGSPWEAEPGRRSPAGHSQTTRRRRQQQEARPHDAREGAAGGGAGEAQRRAAAALEAKALPAEREGPAALRGRQPRLDALQGAQLRARQGRRVRGVEAAAHLLHRGDRRRRRDRLPLPAGGAQLERRHHHGAGALQEPAGGADRARPAQLQGRISTRNSPSWPDSGERAKGARSSAQFGKSGGADGCEFTCQWTKGNSQLPLTVDWLVLFCGIIAGK